MKTSEIFQRPRVQGTVPPNSLHRDGRRMLVAPRSQPFHCAAISLQAAETLSPPSSTGSGRSWWSGSSRTHAFSSTLAARGNKLLKLTGTFIRVDERGSATDVDTRGLGTAREGRFSCCSWTRKTKVRKSVEPASAPSPSILRERGELYVPLGRFLDEFDVCKQRSGACHPDSPPQWKAVPNVQVQDKSDEGRFPLHFNRTLALKHVGSVRHDDGSPGSLRPQHDGNRVSRPHKSAVVELHLGTGRKLVYEPPRGYTKDGTPRSLCVGEKGQWTVHNTQSSSCIAGRRRLSTAIASDTSLDELSRALSSFTLDEEEQVERTEEPVKQKVEHGLARETVAARTTRIQQQAKSDKVVILSLSKPMPLGQNTPHTRPPPSSPPPAPRPTRQPFSWQRRVDDDYSDPAQEHSRRFRQSRKEIKMRDKFFEAEQLVRCPQEEEAATATIWADESDHDLQGPLIFDDQPEASQPPGELSSSSVPSTAKYSGPSWDDLLDLSPENWSQPETGAPETPSLLDAPIKERVGKAALMPISKVQRMREMFEAKIQNSLFEIN